MDAALVAGVVVIGFVHGVLPDHGWPIAAAYGLERPHRLFHGTVAALLLGVGHLFSSVVLVLAYLWFSRFAEFAEGPWMKYVAGTLLILLGVHQLQKSRFAIRLNDLGLGEDVDDGHVQHGSDEHVHGEEDDEDHGHDHHGHGHADGHDHSHGLTMEHADAGLKSLGVTAVVLGFAHEEPVQILGICAGTDHCIELMLVYSLAVVFAILLPTLLLIAGYENHEEKLDVYTPYLPVLTAVVLVAMGSAFILGVF